MKALPKILAVSLLVLFFYQCSTALQKKNDIVTTDSLKHKFTNHLIHETSPYLLQHAHNPVDWYPWNEQTLAKARQENKPMIISIGYAACHWCHVMEKESFEDTIVAKLMNENFICVKVDKEERPDIDQIYMNAIQLLGKSGGWPLNCFALPNGNPFHAGTYFPKEQWMELLKMVAAEYSSNKTKLEDFAKKLTKGIQSSEIIQQTKNNSEFNVSTLEEMLNHWEGRFDKNYGGQNNAPKFPLPNNYLFLNRYANLKKDKNLQSFVELTLQKMAMGGIYDQLGGGFARYSTDRKWKVPHFEKMLYDNAQLVSLYSDAYTVTHDPMYQNVVEETLNFIKREMTSDEGAFYSSLDADSDGEEGRYYTWEKDELQEILGDHFKIFSDYYNVNEKGLWEKEQYILLREESDDIIAAKYHIEVEELHKIIDREKARLLKIREKRIHPNLDDKVITSWNALMLKGCIDAYNTFGDKQYLQIALNNASFIIDHQLRKDGSLSHSYRQGKSQPYGYLEDYAFCIDAFIALYETTFDKQWLDISKTLCDYAIKHFFDRSNSMFWFTSDTENDLIARKQEINDNVIPSSNSVMANDLFVLGTHLDSKTYVGISLQMLRNIQDQISSYGPGYTNWALLLMKQVFTYYEVAFSGKAALTLKKEFNKQYVPNKLMCGSTAPSDLPLLSNKFSNQETRIYVCIGKACKMPVNNVDAAIALIRDM